MRLCLPRSSKSACRQHMTLKPKRNASKQELHEPGLKHGDSSSRNDYKRPRREGSSEDSRGHSHSRKEERQEESTEHISAIKAQVSEKYGQYLINIALTNDLINEAMAFKVLVIKSPYPMILGRHTIKINKISLKCFKYFTGMTSSVEALLEHVRVSTFGVSSNTRVVNAIADRPSLSEAVAGEMRRGQIFHKEELLTPEPDEEYVNPKEQDVTPWEITVASSSVGNCDLRSSGTMSSRHRSMHS